MTRSDIPELLRLLNELESMERHVTAEVDDTSDCLGWQRLRAIAPGGVATAEEEAHLLQCARCRARTAALADRSVPEPRRLQPRDVVAFSLLLAATLLILSWLREPFDKDHADSSDRATASVVERAQLHLTRTRGTADEFWIELELREASSLAVVVIDAERGRWVMPLDEPGNVRKRFPVGTTRLGAWLVHPEGMPARRFAVVVVTEQLLSLTMDELLDGFLFVKDPALTLSTRSFFQVPWAVVPFEIRD